MVLMLLERHMFYFKIFLRFDKIVVLFYIRFSSKVKLIVRHFGKEKEKY